MKKRIPDWLRPNRAMAIQCIAVFAVSTIATFFVARLKGKLFLTTEGFDFSARKQDASSGPAIGGTIELKAPKAKDGRTLADLTRNTRFFVVAVVDPHCPACKAAQNQMVEISKRLNASGIPYFLLMLAKNDHATEYFEYAGSIGLASEEFI